LVSRGSLTPPVNAQASVVGRVVLISWDGNSTSGSAGSTDKALAIVINPDYGEAVYKIAGAARSSGMEILDLPPGTTGDQIVVYLGFISDDGEEISDSVYVGSVMLP